MIYIEHRINTLEALQSLNPQHGAEIDLRTHNDTIILAHDPLKTGADFIEWLKIYKSKNIQGPLILNTKEDGLEDMVIKILESQQISNYLFLDTTVPTLVKHSLAHSEKFMLRLSHYEPLAAIESLAHNHQWLWVDCFYGKPLDPAALEQAHKKFKLCMVSPELQGFDLDDKLPEFLKIKKYFSAICTKHVSKWQSV